MSEHLQRDVAEQLALQALAQVPRGDELPVASGHRRRVDAEHHRHRRLVDGNRRDGEPVFRVGDGLADGDVLDAGEADDVAGGGLGDLDALEALEGIELRDARLQRRAVQLEHDDRIADRAPVPLKMRPMAMRPR